MPRKARNWQGEVYHDCRILEPCDENSRSGHDYWKIKCHCTKIFTAQPSEIKRGNITSCNCNRIAASRGRMLKQIKNNNNKGIGTQKKDYRNYISENNIKIIEPVIDNKDTGKDLWYVLCPKCNKVFETQPTYVISGKLQSCECSRYENMRKGMRERYNKIKENNGGIGLTDLNNLLRSCIFAKIRDIIFQIDEYTCNLCYSNHNTYFNAHHINPIKYNSNFTFDNKEDFYLIYDINNIITLCKKCHINLAHDGNGKYGLNLDIQKELQAITSMRFIKKEIMDEYNKIVKEQIEPWIDNYLSAKTSYILL